MGTIGSKPELYTTQTLVLAFTPVVGRGGFVLFFLHAHDNLLP